ncbi:MAG TPA: acylhydrolase [Roseburia sp.]|nr:acylhydrolase [Roseburia sp.]
MKCRVAVFLLAGWVILSLIGYLKKDGIYKNYSIDTKKTPYFVLVLDGIHDKIYPWSKEPPELLSDQKKPKKQEDDIVNTEITEETATEAVAGDTETTDLKPKKFIQVDDSYFDDAVFIGDSRTVGLHDYGGLDHSDFYATVGMNIYDLWKEAFCNVDGKKVTLEEALKAKQYKKVYFQIGINEMGRGTLDGFMDEYQNAVEKFKTLQPDAIIYVQAIMHVTQKKSDSDPIFNNPGIDARNQRIQQLADGVRVFYIDVNEVVCDDQGGLKQELTFDNLHLYGSKYNIWVDFLKTKGIETE